MEESGFTNSLSKLPLKINYAQPVFQVSSISIIPDIKKLMENDYISYNSVILLKQFIQTPTLKTEVRIEPINIFISSNELNFAKPLPVKIIQNLIQEKFSNTEFNIVDDIKSADYTISVESNTSVDISNDVLKGNYNLNLAALTINIGLKNKAKETLYSCTISDINGYANSAEKAGINSYTNPKLAIKLNESFFFLKRKMVHY